jgi:hypothetical protein
MTRRTAVLDLTAPGERTDDAQEVWRALTLGSLGWVRGIRSRVMPDLDLTAVGPEGMRIVVVRQPPVSAARARHLTEGAIVVAYQDDEVPPVTVRLSKPARVVPVRQFAVRVPTPDGDVRLWPGEFMALD